MRLCSIASGSSGNCVYAGSDTTHLLVDTGISGKRTEKGLETLGITMRDIDGILITHEHIDHISGLGVLARKYHVPIYATKKTIAQIKKTSLLGEIEDALFCPIVPDERFTVKDLTLYPMRISHDATDPVAYRIQYGKKKIAVMTDLGAYNDYTVECLQGMDAILLEANHDIRMLQAGPYPYYLKQRILSERGHLSNESSGRLLSKILHDGMKAVLLGHLSKENNLAELAYEAVRVEITLADNRYTADDFPICVADRAKVSQVIFV